MNSPQMPQMVAALVKALSNTSDLVSLFLGEQYLTGENLKVV